MRRLGRLTALVLGCALALPAGAAAQNRIYNDYRQDGQVNPCQYSRGELRRGLEGLPPDVEQYLPGLSDQLRRSCNQGGGAAPAPQEQTAAPTATTPSGGPPAPPRARTVVADPPAPKASSPASVTGVAPDVSRGPLPDIPPWLAGLLAAVGAGGVAALLAVRYGALDPSGLMRSLRASLSR